MEASWVQLLLVLLLCTFVSGNTDPKDASVLHSLKDQWQHTPPSWDMSDDPCGSSWEGVTCNYSRVTALKLSSMGLQGTLDGDIGELNELRSLDLSFNTGLTGPVSPMIGNLQKLTILILAGCRFTGNIPSEIGNLKQLSFLALNTNNFTGEIPASLGGLSNLYWLDVADNRLTGPLPISTPTKPGLDQLLKAKHFHFNKNRLSGTILAKLFSSKMVLTHIIFDGNQFSGRIPSTLGLVQTLEVLRLDRNSLSGPVPSSLSNLVKIIGLNLANNQLTGPVPELTNMSSLNFADLSNNSFDASDAPTWFSTIQNLTTLVMEYGALQGKVPEHLFSFPQLQEVRLKNNSFNSTLDMGSSISEQLQLVDLENNQITMVTVGPIYNKALNLLGNPACTSKELVQTDYCQNRLHMPRSYSTSYVDCGDNTCPSGQRHGPRSCDCAFPYEGVLYFQAPFFSDLSNRSRFQLLEEKILMVLGLTPHSVSLQNPFFNTDDYLEVHLELYPSTGKYFNRSEIQKFGFHMTNQTFKPPHDFGPFLFVAFSYPFPDVDQRGKSSTSTGLIIGIAIGCALLVLIVVGVGACAFRGKKQAYRTTTESKPLASWGSSTSDSGGAPQLKGARWFSYFELKSATNNFSERNEIGSGGYGKVYKGILLGQQMVAIKRAQQESMQRGLEFKTEIELLSRVHHKNLVSLIGFCFEHDEQMLVYEYVPNGSLRDSLSGRSGVPLDWKSRLRVALCAARGLTYLHEFADPPIIHRDVKSSNILLDENLMAKVSDFGLSKLVADSSKGHVSTQVKGTMGYMDPDYFQTQQLTGKSDVYSFGVVLLELITAKQPIDKGNYIVLKVKKALNPYKEHYGLLDLMDPSIRYESNLIGFKTLVDLAIKCVEETAAERPTMSKVVKEIEAILQNEGMKTNPNTTTSSTRDYGCRKDAPQHPYMETMPKKEEISDPFGYSIEYTLSVNMEPK